MGNIDEMSDDVIDSSTADDGGDDEFDDTERICGDCGELHTIAVMESRSNSREFKRKSPTRNLLGEATSNGSFGEKQRRFAIKKPIRVFFGDGSISDSDTSDEHDACDVSDIVSKSMCIGDDVTYLGI